MSIEMPLNKLITRQKSQDIVIQGDGVDFLNCQSTSTHMALVRVRIIAYAWWMDNYLK